MIELPSSPLFSIGVTVYNAQAYLLAALQSAAEQRYRNIEIVIVDDSSTDDSYAIAESFAKAEPRATLIRQPHAGYGAALKAAIDNAHGDYFGILDADDLLFSRGAEKAVDYFLSHPNTDFLWSQYVRSDGILGHSRPLSNDISILDDWPCGHFRVFRTACYQKSVGLDPAIQAAVDRDLLLKLEEVGQGAFLDETLYFYRINPDGISESRRTEQQAFEKQVKQRALERRALLQD